MLEVVITSATRKWAPGTLRGKAMSLTNDNNPRIEVTMIFADCKDPMAAAVKWAQSIATSEEIDPSKDQVRVYPWTQARRAESKSEISRVPCPSDSENFPNRTQCKWNRHQESAGHRSQYSVSPTRPIQANRTYWTYGYASESSNLLHIGLTMIGTVLFSYTFSPSKIMLATFSVAMWQWTDFPFTGCKTSVAILWSWWLLKISVRLVLDCFVKTLPT